MQIRGHIRGDKIRRGPAKRLMEVIDLFITWPLDLDIINRKILAEKLH
jgi:hypothetical protein